MRSLPLVPKAWKPLLCLAISLGLTAFLLPNDYFFVLFNIMALNALVVLGLNLLIGCAGQISLGHGAFFGLGAYSSAIVTTQLHWPLWAGLAVALAVTALFGIALAVPTLRLEGHYLVMATLGFNIIVSIGLNQMEPLTGGPSGLAAIPGMHLGPWALDTDRRFFFFAWSVFLAVFAGVLNLEDSRIGRALKAIHDKELTARTLGVPTPRYKVQVFTLSAMLAGLAGFSYAHYMTFISPSTFDIFYSVQVITMVVVGGLGSLWGGLAGTVILTSLRELLHAMEDFQVLVYGLLLTLSLVFFPQGLLPAALNAFWRAGHRTPSRSMSGPSSPKDDARSIYGSGFRALSPSTRKPDSSKAKNIGETPVLRVANLSVQFGGLQALAHVSFSVHSGEIVAVIGPNGAGKTTLLNAVSGLVRFTEGHVAVRDVDVSRRPAHEVARTGVGRTFQAVQIFEHLTVLENLMVGMHHFGRSRFLQAMAHTLKERREEKELRRRAMELLEETPLAALAHEPAATLSLFQQKLLEMLRALAMEPAVLLLDEPVGGCSPNESRALMDWIATHQRVGMGMVLVEHDMNIVMAYATRVVVLHHGRVLAEGAPLAIQKDPRVIEAYLGRGRRGAGQP
ncbi:branched-chain amino acid ABC transporter ATP-binding protein/permease [Desulfosoma caldarium]|uniref:Amino acid/amide ABC transporter membrane protein 2 (HAAT family) /amino acid/amide ABC transporter ATP-binding protein 1 (HAAT family) n=1 Tax=Desulfosoma caldarium TaxID=610254 RepID=A0A3N1VS65_9BACT|nr:branched-chain amino acid ABC transporter ATP-binding protein/permease [Desulfosoma caldarium]ROR03082.1 amino acid/amide ABC transporter membrane protein 2 (HAAT family) /amino acid/amide ABC transporter ATP-binding protein 1 (HAAT family) [Desulfosoma caldarium]